MAVAQHALTKELIAVKTFLFYLQLSLDAGKAIEFGAVGTDVCFVDHIFADGAGYDLDKASILL